MAECKLVYINYRGRAELIRFILAQAGVKYDDSRIELEKWAELRPGTQFGILPYMEVDGKTISGNATIARYMAEKHNLGGDNALENVELSAIVEVCEDLWTRMTTIFWQSNETVKTEAKRMFKESYLPVALSKLEKQIATNKSDSGWICSNKVTYADFAVYVLLECLVPEMPPLTDNFPNIAKLMEAVAGLERIKEWMDNRPKTAH